LKRKKIYSKDRRKKYEKYLEKQRKPMKNYRPNEKSKIGLVFLIVNVL